MAMRNRALLIGINSYPESPLRGCVNDVLHAADFLVDYCNFKKSEIRILTDERATTEAIEDRCTWLAADAMPGDRLILWYSGHGTMWVDRGDVGYVFPPECAICPVDFDWTYEHVITAGEFGEIFSTLPPGVIFNWINDSCHSGDLARAASNPGFAFEGTVIGTRQYPMNLDMWWRIETAKSLNFETVGFETAIEHLHGALISGCESNQTSADALINGEPCGAFSHYLMNNLKIGGLDLELSLKKLVNIVTNDLHLNNYTQTPQLRGDDFSINRSWLNTTE